MALRRIGPDQFRTPGGQLLTAEQALLSPANNFKRAQDQPAKRPTASQLFKRRRKGQRFNGPQNDNG